MDVMYEYEAAYAKEHVDLPAKVFFSVGEYETSQGDKRKAAWLSPDGRAAAEADADAHPFDQVEGTERMVGLLRGRGYPSLETECEVLPGEYHPTQLPLSLSRSLRYLFDAPR
jgi:hypothetical protein